MQLHLTDFQKLFDAAPVGLAVLDRDLRYLFCNAALAAINGIPAEAHIGKTVADIVPGLADMVDGPFRSVFQFGEPLVDLRLTGDVRLQNGSSRSWLENVQPIRGEDGCVAAILVSVQEITALEEAQKALRESEQTLQASQRLNPHGFAILRAVRGSAGEVLDFEWEYANPAAQRLSRGNPLVGRRLLQTAPPGGTLEQAFARYAETLDSGVTSELEFEYENVAVRRWFRTTVVAIDEDRIALSFADITDQKAYESGLQLALQEFKHRVKNLLAVVSSLVTHAKRTSRTPGELADTLHRQLKALSAAQEIIGRNAEHSIALEEIVSYAIRPFRVPGLIVHDGPKVMLDAELVLPLALAMHELATNAMKYGALSEENGEVHIAWRVQDDRVRLEWTEADGPPVEEPMRSGFGSTLLRSLEKRLSAGKVELRFLPTGLKASIEFDLT
jgi:PAS domain S-box-containing protein